MNLKGLLVGMAALMVSLTMFVADTGTAFAHYVYSTGFPYYTAEDCVWGYSETSHGNGNGYSKSEMQSKFIGGAGSYCANPFNRPAGYMRVRQIFQMQLAPGWGFCRDTGQLYNTSSTWVFTVARTHGSKCGSYNYRTESQVYMLNGSWKGGPIYSPAHWL